MDTQFVCKNENRREAIRNNAAWNGIDFLEVAAADQKTLTVTFIHNLPGQPGPVPPVGPALTPENIIIEGGVRIRNIDVLSVSATNNELTVTVDKAGDFSWYTLRIVSSNIDHKPPTGYDPQLSHVEFSFKAACPNEFDCKADEILALEKFIEPKIDYLAKDYASFRRIILDRLSLILPEWKERNPADQQIMLVELLAYLGDQLSYYQDAVATEAYLGTARKRISVRRHARLLDYNMHDGCNARTWIHFEVEAGGTSDGANLKAGTQLLTHGPDGESTVASANLTKVLNEQNAQVFETKNDIKLLSNHNQISFYAWSDSECCLPKGTTRATLKNDQALSLQPFDVLIFEERFSPTTGLAADADKRHRYAVRLNKVTKGTDLLTSANVLEIEWFDEDALPFPLCLTALISSDNGTKKLVETSVALGNIVLADHGIKFENQELIPDSAPMNGIYRPWLRHTNITVLQSYLHESDKKIAASNSLIQDPQKSLADITLFENDETWKVSRDLLASNRFSTEFVAEIEQDGITYLRFGDDIMGKRPSGGFHPSATYRIGNGKSGNVGQDSITRVVWDLAGIDVVRNPLPARGGTNPETMAEAKEFAPQAFRTQARAVTEADYAEKAELHPEVQKAAARFHWTGSWHTVFVTIDRKNGLDVNDDFKKEIILHLENYRMAGYDLEIRQPQFVPLDIGLSICVKPGYFRTNVEERLLEVFSRYDLSDGIRGFFHPDNFTFGQRVFLSAIYKRAMDVAGVESVEAKTFKRWAKKPGTELADGYLKPEELEIIRLDNDPSFPENGKIEFKMVGGL
jgi:hypothetical protein